MNIPKDQLIKVLTQLNPWWKGAPIEELPRWKRTSFNEIYQWVHNPPAPRALLLSGARQIGKTTLLLQVINALLLETGVAPANILYVTFDHPLVKMAGIDTVLEAWRECEPRLEGKEYLFLDEAQFVDDFGTWVKHQVDFVKYRRITFTGSAMPLLENHQESGVGRWYTLRLTTLSFYEYLQLKREQHEKTTKQSFLPALPSIDSLRDVFDLSQQERYRIIDSAEPYIGHFNHYLVRGGFPQTALVDSIHQAHKLLRDDIVDKVLKRDMTALFGVRRVVELEQTFLYLCMHDGGLLDMQQLCRNLSVKRPTAQHFIDLFEAAHLIYRLGPYGYGKEILRAKFKVYLADPAIAAAVLLKGKRVFENSSELGIATEAAVVKHLYAPMDVRLSYWRGSKSHEVDVIAQTRAGQIPFEIKYRAQKTGVGHLKGLIEFCQKEAPPNAYVVTQRFKDFGLLQGHGTSTKIMQIPAALLCYWIGELASWF